MKVKDIPDTKEGVLLTRALFKLMCTNEYLNMTGQAILDELQNSPLDIGGKANGSEASK